LSDEVVAAAASAAAASHWQRLSYQMHLLCEHDKSKCDSVCPDIMISKFTLQNAVIEGVIPSDGPQDQPVGDSVHQNVLQMTAAGIPEYKHFHCVLTINNSTN